VCVYSERRAELKLSCLELEEKIHIGTNKLEYQIVLTNIVMIKIFKTQKLEYCSEIHFGSTFSTYSPQGGVSSH
jgi:hypothetical protein